MRREFPQLEVVHLPNYDRVTEEIADADIAISWSLRGEQIKAARKLRWIHSTAAAVHQLMTPELRASNILVTNARDVHGPVVAEHAIALAFALAKRLPQAVKHQQQKHWAQHDLWNAQPRPRELSGATMTIVGIGGIGRPLAKLAKALGMRVVGVREHPERRKRSGQCRLRIRRTRTALQEGDFVVLAVPVTPKTHHLMNAERLAQLKPDAYLINVGRGVLIDEDALVQALEREKIRRRGARCHDRRAASVRVSPFGRWTMFLSRPTSRALRNECGSAITRITPRTCDAIWRVSRYCGWWTSSAGINIWAQKLFRRFSCRKRDSNLSRFADVSAAGARRRNPEPSEGPRKTCWCRRRDSNPHTLAGTWT